MFIFCRCRTRTRRGPRWKTPSAIPPIRLEGPFRPCPGGARDGTCLEARGRVDFAAEGTGLLETRLFLRPGWPTGLLLVALPSDAGCGAACRESAREELRTVMGSFRPAPGPPRNVPAGTTLDLPQPLAWNGPQPHDERERPWRTYRLGGAMRVEVPPGVVAAELGSMPLDFTPPSGARLWLRGTFVDQQGRKVRIGDENWYGWVRVTAASPAAGEGPGPPELDPEARLGPAVSLDRALTRLRLPGSGSVRRATGRAFEGTWILFRRSLAGQVVEGFLPVGEGAESLSLLYMPLTVHTDRGDEPPPLVDLASRYEVRFDRFRDPERRADPRAGLLYAAEIQLPVPRGFRVSLNRRSADGFPLTLRHEEDGTLMRIHRWPAKGGAPELLRVRAENQAGGPPPDGWRAGRKVRGGETLLADYPARSGREASPQRCLTLLLARQPSERAAYLLELIRGAEAADPEWKAACRLARAVRFRRRQPRR
ncbi:MAG: hypothetical protein Q9Q13_07365 [Acidobacteriota bacterium]|nr:hypothetical protein [Acidobacteriota bacterium]